MVSYSETMSTTVRLYPSVTIETGTATYSSDTISSSNAGYTGGISPMVSGISGRSGNVGYHGNSRRNNTLDKQLQKQQWKEIERKHSRK